MNNLNPHWVPFTITTSSLCGNDENRNIKVGVALVRWAWHQWVCSSLVGVAIISGCVPIQVKCYDWDSDGSHDLIGDFNTSYHQLSTAPQGTKVINNCYK